MGIFQSYIIYGNDDCFDLSVVTQLTEFRREPGSANS